MLESHLSFRSAKIYHNRHPIFRLNNHSRYKKVTFIFWKLCTNPPSLPANSPAFLCFCIIFCLWVEWAKRRRECFFFSPFLTLPSSYCVWANEMYSCLLNHIYIYTHPKTSYRLYSALRSEVVALKAVSVPWSSSKETLANIPNILVTHLGVVCQFLTRIRGPPSWVRTRTHGLPRSCGGIAIASTPSCLEVRGGAIDVVVSIEYAYNWSQIKNIGSVD